MMKRILAMLLVMGMTIALTACGGQEETGQEGSSESEEKVIVVGTDGSTSGYSVLKDDGELEGFEIDVWNEIGEREQEMRFSLNRCLSQVYLGF